MADFTVQHFMRGGNKDRAPTWLAISENYSLEDVKNYVRVSRRIAGIGITMN